MSFLSRYLEKRKKNKLPKSVKRLNGQIINFTFFPLLFFIIIFYLLPNIQSFLVFILDVLIAYSVTGIAYQYFKKRGWLKKIDEMPEGNQALVLEAENECPEFKASHDLYRSSDGKYYYTEVNKALRHLDDQRIHYRFKLARPMFAIKRFLRSIGDFKYFEFLTK